MSALHQALLRDFRRMSRNRGLESGGVECQAATTADGLNRQWFVGWLIARGATVYYDAIGNEFGLFELCPGAPYVMVGSHLDSQPRAVRFDGAYGVLAGATVCAELYRAAPSGETELTDNLCVVNWFHEEGCRFTPSMMGSLVHATWGARKYEFQVLGEHSHKGITHNEYEFTSDQDMLAGLDMLTATLTRAAQGELDG